MRLAILAFAAGIAGLQCQPELPALEPCLLLALAGFLAAALGRRCKSAWAPLPFLLSCAVLGVAYAGWRAELRLQDSLSEAATTRDIQLVGVIASLPQRSERGVRFVFDVEQVFPPELQVPAHLQLSAYRPAIADGEPFAPQAGERWRLPVRLRPPHGNANPGGFDYEAWLLERNIRAVGYVRPGAAQRLSPLVSQPGYWLERLRAHIRGNFERQLPEADYPWSGILIALAMGDQHAMPADSWRIFNRTGTSHLNSISGLHVTMVAALIGRLVGWLWRRIPWLVLRCPAQTASLLATASGALAYALLAGFAVPAQRTAYMLLVSMLAMLSGRVLCASRILLLALLVVLLIDPWSVLAVGFWLSFMAVAALLFVAGGQFRPAHNWRERLYGWSLVQWAATLASLPILLLVFQQFSLVSPLANALAIPVIGLLVTPLALLASVLPWGPLMVLAHVILDGLMHALAWFAEWPLWQSPAPPAWAVGLAMLGVFVALLPRGVAGRGLGLCLVLPLLAWPAPRLPAAEVRIDILDVGQGLASVIRTATHVLIYDPGPLYSAESDAGQRVVLPYLRSLGIGRIDRLIITHRDSDHAGGAAALLSQLAVDSVWSSVAGFQGERCVAGQRWQWDGVAFEILHPEAAAYATPTRSNHLACVLRISTGDRHVLLSSDIEAEDEFSLLRRVPERLPADLLLVPHHGSKTSSTAAFLDAVQAPVAVIPVGFMNRFGHPHPSVLARYRERGIRLWRTDQQGAISLAMSAQGGLSLSAWREEHPRYWHGR